MAMDITSKKEIVYKNWYVRKQRKNIKSEPVPAILDYPRLSPVIKGYQRLSQTNFGYI